jgi:ribonuclease P protein component
MSERTNAFGRASRLLRTSEFERVYSARKSAANEVMVVYAVPNELGWSRLGLSIGRKAGGAVERNLVKRRLREAFRTAGDAVPAGFDFVVTARKGIADAPFDRMKASLLRLASEAAGRWRKQ